MNRSGPLRSMRVVGCLAGVTASLAAGAAALAAPGAASPAEEPARREKLAVLVLGTTEKDAELADNLTEVLIGSIAQRRGVEMAGREEFRARLGVESEQRAQACIDDLACLGRAAVSLGVRRIVAGTVGTRGKQYLFNLNLNNIETSRVENHIFRMVEGGVKDLIPAVQSATDELFRPRVEPGRIQLSSTPEGARVSIDNAYLGVTLTEANLPRRRQWPATAAVASASLAALSLAAGGFLGVLSQPTPSGSTRAEAQKDFDQKRQFAIGADAGFIAGAVFGVAALCIVLGYRDDVFGRSDDDAGK